MRSVADEFFSLSPKYRTKKRLNDLINQMFLGGGAVGHDCKDACIVCQTHNALEILACYALEGRFGTKHDKVLGDILPYSEISIKPREGQS